MGLHCYKAILFEASVLEAISFKATMLEATVLKVSKFYLNLTLLGAAVQRLLC